MPEAEYSIQWHNAEKTILLFHYTGRLKAEPYLAAFEACSQVMGEVEHNVDLIFDMSDVTHLDVPGLLQALPQFNKAAAPNHGLSVVIGMSPAARVLVNAAANLAPKLIGNVRQARSMAEAHQIIAKHRGQAEPAGRGMTQRLG